MLPYWYDGIVPDLRRDLTVAVVAHGNSLRALVKHLDGMSDEAVVALNIPTGVPLLYELDDAMRPLTVRRRVPRPGGRCRRHRGRPQPGPLIARCPFRNDHVHHPYPYITRPASLVMYVLAW